MEKFERQIAEQQGAWKAAAVEHERQVHQVCARVCGCVCVLVATSVKMNQTASGMHIHSTTCTRTRRSCWTSKRRESR
jgi:hypothetical protein